MWIIIFTHAFVHYHDVTFKTYEQCKIVNESFFIPGTCVKVKTPKRSHK